MKNKANVLKLQVALSNIRGGRVERWEGGKYTVQYTECSTVLTVQYREGIDVNEDGREIKKAAREIREAAREIRGDAREIREEGREIRKDGREIRADGREIR